MLTEYRHLDPTLLLPPLTLLPAGSPGIAPLQERREIFLYSECPRQERETCQAGQDMVT